MFKKNKKSNFFKKILSTILLLFYYHKLWLHHKKIRYLCSNDYYFVELLNFLWWNWTCIIGGITWINHVKTLKFSFSRGKSLAEQRERNKKSDINKYLNKQFKAEALQKEKEKDALILANTTRQSKKEDIDIISKLKMNELFMKSDIMRLKKEIVKNNETWEKKFDVLKHR